MKFTRTALLAVMIAAYGIGNAAADPAGDAAIRSARSVADFQKLAQTTIAPGVTRSEAMLTNVARLNQVAFVYLLQSEFTSKGLYQGRLSGTFDKPTIRAMQKFCALNGIQKTCAAAPMAGGTMALLARALSNTIANPTTTGAEAGKPGVLPTGWTGDEAKDGISREIVSAADGTLVLRYRGKATAAGFLNLHFNDDTGVPTSKDWHWQAGVTGSATSAGGANDPVTLQVELANAPGNYVGELFPGVALPAAHGAPSYISGDAVVQDATATALLPYLHLKYEAGDDVDVTVSLNAPTLARVD